MCGGSAGLTVVGGAPDGAPVHIGEALTGDMPRAAGTVGDGAGGIAGDRVANSLIAKNAASKTGPTARFRLAAGRFLTAMPAQPARACVIGRARGAP
jgi:hypothetical protein